MLTVNQRCPPAMTTNFGGLGPKCSYDAVQLSIQNQMHR